MSANKDKCEVCSYCVANMDNKQLVYNCKRYPPVPFALPSQGPMGQMGISVINVRPTVTLNDSCGEFDLSMPTIKLVT